MKAMKEMKGFKGLGNKMLGGMKRRPTNGIAFSRQRISSPEDERFIFAWG